MPSPGTILSTGVPAGGNTREEGEADDDAGDQRTDDQGIVVFELFA